MRDLDWKHSQEPNRDEEPAAPAQQNTLEGSIPSRTSCGQSRAKKDTYG